MNWLKDTIAILSLALGLLPQIIKIVTEIEEQIKIPGVGAEKLGIILAAVREAAFNLLPDDLEKKIGLDKIEKYITGVVGYIVGVFNKLGVFSKGGQ